MLHKYHEKYNFHQDDLILLVIIDVYKALITISYFIYSLVY